MQSLKVLVTGASGFVGKAVVAELVRAGHQVMATATRHLSDLPSAPNLCWMRWDAARDPLPQMAWDDLGVVLHLAAPPDPFAFPEHAEIVFQVSVSATFHLLEAARRKGVKRVLIASTGDVLGGRPQPPGEDDVLYQPSSFYGAAKACAELLLRSYRPVLETAILRFYHPYGPGGDRFLVNRLCRQVAEGREIRVQGARGVRLNPVWIEDLAVGVRKAVESGATGIFHFAGPEVVTLRQLLEVIEGVVGRKLAMRVEAAEGIERHAGSFEVTRRVLDYNPRVTLQDGVRRLWDRVREAEREKDGPCQK